MERLSERRRTRQANDLHRVAARRDQRSLGAGWERAGRNLEGLDDLSYTQPERGIPSKSL